MMPFMLFKKNITECLRRLKRIGAKFCTSFANRRLLRNNHDFLTPRGPIQTQRI
ncbi:hypothetical protein FKM82_004905 [Ascaphus truei]